MEIKQLEYFVATADHGSLNRAAERLYTSQPNVSKVIAALEKEIGVQLFKRNNRGIELTEHGKMLYGHASSILKSSDIILSMAQKQTRRSFSVSGYQSSLIARFMAEIYEGKKNELKLEYREGVVEEITDNVADHISEIGIVYIAKDQICCFRHIIGHKKLEFHPLFQRGICIYIGSKHPFYNRDSIDFSELTDLKFMQGKEDFFAIEHHIEKISGGTAHIEHLNAPFYTNSDYMIHNLLKHTDVCCMGIDLVSRDYENQGIKALKVNNCQHFLTLGYVNRKKDELSEESKMLIEKMVSYNESL
ncbi:LysR family transcriptional regulator [Lacrimispora sp.]|uniref:LysR family transcriptional regulator n=1 Tax=Lacrimispora sp. TaxID=2719234 RepID=UPI0034609DDB